MRYRTFRKNDPGDLLTNRDLAEYCARDTDEESKKLHVAARARVIYYRKAGFLVPSDRLTDARKTLLFDKREIFVIKVIEALQSFGIKNASVLMRASRKARHQQKGPVVVSLGSVEIKVHL